MQRRAFLKALVVGIASTTSLTACLATNPAPANQAPLNQPPVTPPQSAPAQAAAANAVHELVLSHYSQDSGPTYTEAARVLVDTFGKIGLTVKPQPLQFNTFINTVQSGGKIEDMALGVWGGEPDRMDPHHWIREANHSKAIRNASHYNNAEYDKLAEAQDNELDQAKRKAIITQAQQLHAKEEPYWQLYMLPTTYVYNTRRFPDLKPIPPLGFQFALPQLLDLTPADPSHKTLVFSWFQDFTSWNVFAESSAGRRCFQRHVYDTFTRISYDGKLVPWAAESWNVVDPTTIDINLRQGMKFHDGQPVTVDDAVFSFNYWIKWQPPLWTAGIVNQQSAEKVDDRTFRVKLKQPWAAFFAVDLAFAVLLPKHIWEKVPEQVGVAKPWDWDPVAANAVIGSGPFKFVAWRQAQELIVKANPDHWNAPKIDGYQQLFLTTADATSAGVERGDIDLALAPMTAANEKELAGQHPDFLAYRYEPVLTTVHLWLNLNKKPFNDPAFRRALHQATPKQQIVDIALLGFGEPGGDGPIPPILGDWYDKSLPRTEFSLEQARETLTRAGYTWGSGGRLQFPA
jgi:peptide/nickel transport system substrate-binding protein